MLPKKRQVLQKIIDFQNFRTADAASDVAKEIYYRWLWSNVYPLLHLTIASKVQTLVACFCKLDWWPNQKRCAEFFLQKETEFLFKSIYCSTLFASMVISENASEKKHKLRMIEEYYAFSEDQRGPCVAKCLDVVVPLSS